jgi:lipopolysaccharide cholinephosphotransferase
MDKTFSSDDLKSIQAKLFSILCSFAFACDSLGLRYYLFYGTLLGALRHQGFIPWDDDIDVAMPEEDYLVFLEKGQSCLPKHLFVQHWSTEKEFLLPYMKIRDSSTSFFELTDCHLKINHGLWIDVFPIDGCSRHRLMVRAQKNQERTMAYSEEKWRNPRSLPDVKPFKKFLKSCYKVLFVSRYSSYSKQMIAKKWSEIHSKYPLCVSGGCHIGNEFFKSNPFGTKKRTLLFEGRAFQVPEFSELITRERYGDYMKLPPENERIPHHNLVYFDLKTPYSDKKVYEIVKKSFPGNAHRV